MKRRKAMPAKAKVKAQSSPHSFRAKSSLKALRAQLGVSTSGPTLVLAVELTKRSQLVSDLSKAIIVH